MSNLTFPLRYQSQPYPHQTYHPVECPTCTGKNPKYVFGSAILTILIGALAFITALAWNDYARFAFAKMVDDDEELAGTKLNYAFIATSIAIVVGFLLMFYVEGEKW